MRCPLAFITRRSLLRGSDFARVTTNAACQYQRLVLGDHGCEKSVADRVLTGDDTLWKSEKSYDGLGSGIYFWKHGPERSLEAGKGDSKRIDSGADERLS